MVIHKIDYVKLSTLEADAKSAGSYFMGPLYLGRMMNVFVGPMMPISDKN